MKTLILNSLNHLQKDETGQGLVEYLLILALVASTAPSQRSAAFWANIFRSTPETWFCLLAA